ncbi:cytochrome P450 [Xylariaceae sp. FL0255]|nr:cytochrome P450 [Xylariaceae sp. FL0255]
MVFSAFTPGQLLARIGISLVLLLLHRVFQSRFINPLRTIPGPFLNSITELPAALALLRGEQHVYYQSLHDKYGPVVRVSPDEVSFITAAARQEIHGLRKNGLNMEKSPIFLGAVGAEDGQTGVSLATKDNHMRQRKALGYIFSNTALVQLEDLVQGHIQKLMNIIANNAAKKQPMDVSSWFSYVAFDMVGDLCFAEPFGCLDTGADTEWSTSVIEIFVGATWTQGIRRLSGVGTYLESLMTRLLIPAKAAEWRRIHIKNAREKTQRRLEDRDREHTDFMSHVLRNTESKRSLSQTEIILNMAGFVSGGTDTTATALAGWTYFMCTHPNAYKRVAEEVRSAFTSSDELRWDKVKELSFLGATIHEAMRLYPPSPASQQRIVPAGGATIEGYYIPEKKTVAVAPWVSTHSSLNFKDPLEFHPERWLTGDEAGSEFANDKLVASSPFGIGPRVCMGKNLAQLEMRLIAAHMLWSFDFELDRGQYLEKNHVWGLDGKLKNFKIFHSMTKPALWVSFTKRSES